MIESVGNKWLLMLGIAVALTALWLIANHFWKNAAETRIQRLLRLAVSYEVAGNHQLCVDAVLEAMDLESSLTSFGRIEMSRFYNMNPAIEDLVQSIGRELSNENEESFRTPAEFELAASKALADAELWASDAALARHQGDKTRSESLLRFVHNTKANLLRSRYSRASDLRRRLDLAVAAGVARARNQGKFR